MTPAILFAVLAGTAAAAWATCLRFGSSRVDAVFGAVVITGVAFLVNLSILLAMRAGGHRVMWTQDAIWLFVMAGVAASGVDIFGLLAYRSGLRLSSSIIIGGTSTALVIVIGIVALHEPVTWSRLLAVVLVAGGVLLFRLEGT